MIVLGGGVIGLMIAWHLATCQAVKIRAIIESDERPSATAVAAGMLAPICEGFLFDPQFMQIGIASLNLYKDFLARLQNQVKRVPQLFSAGTLLVAEDQDGFEWLKNRYQTLQLMGMTCQWLSREELRTKEPFIGSSASAAVYLSTEKNLLVSSLSDALRLALQKLKVQFLHKTIVKIERSDRWMLTCSKQSTLTCKELVIANGAWQNTLQMKIDTPKIIPNQGQIVTARLPKDVSINHMIRTRDVYICPKEDGTLLLGASSEFVGYDLNPTLGNIYEILRDASTVLPSICDAHFIDVASGLRPMSSTTGHPIVEKGNHKGLFWAVGHGRSGILLAPWTAKRLLELVEGK